MSRKSWFNVFCTTRRYRLSDRGQLQEHQDWNHDQRGFSLSLRSFNLILFLEYFESNSNKIVLKWHDDQTIKIGHSKRTDLSIDNIPIWSCCVICQYIVSTYRKSSKAYLKEIWTDSVELTSRTYSSWKQLLNKTNKKYLFVKEMKDTALP